MNERSNVRGIGRALRLVVAVAAGATSWGCTTPDGRIAFRLPSSPEVVSIAGRLPVERGDEALDEASFIRKHYVKHEYRVPMRDGVKLFTTVYAPRDRSQPYPILLFRTPYSCSPYGEDRYRKRLGSGRHMAEEGFIFVYQDVRGRFMSEGEFVNMRPHIDEKKSPADVDESSDTFDTIDWLLKHVPNHNGRVGMWGISYPGFYAAAGMIDHHPALVAVSPQAPIADWWFDDFHHHGALFLPHAFGFLYVFGPPRPEPTTEWPERFKFPTPDGYRFFLDLGPMRNVNERYYHHNIAFWDRIVEHPNYDGFWQARNLLPHLHDVAPAVMIVGGWFDAEDLYGALNIYRSIEEKNPDVFNMLVMGPWVHGGWARTPGDRVGNVYFGSETSMFYRERMELPFFRYYLKDEGKLDLPEAFVFETGRNRWRRFDDWPPAGVEMRKLFFREDGGLSFEGPGGEGMIFDEYISDPDKPVPFTETITTRMTKEYMTDDQRFAGRRPDVLVYQTEPLEHPVTFAGPITADLWVSTSKTDADWVVKVIDVFPPDAEDFPGIEKRMHTGGYQMMVRSEVIRGRFRDSDEHPRPFVPDQPTRVRLPLQDVLHTFKPGHRIMVQVQSTWFPLVDRNPQTYVDNIYLAREEDFTQAVHRVYRSQAYASHLQVGVLPPGNE